MKPQKESLAILFIMVLMGAPAALGSEENVDLTSPVGIWKTFDDKTKKPKALVEIWEKNGVYGGKIISLILEEGEDPNPLCDKCTGDRKDKPVLGMTIIWGLKKKGDKYTGGKILDPENGKTYKCTLKLTDGGKALKVRGYIGVSALGRNQYWKRRMEQKEIEESP
jgi:uncharacterized protein (DUF2147 family)